MEPSTGSVPSAEMIRSFASNVADMTGSSCELDGPGAFEGITCGNEGIVGSAGGPRGRSGGGVGNGRGRGGGEGKGTGVGDNKRTGVGDGNGSGGGEGNGREGRPSAGFAGRWARAS